MLCCSCGTLGFLNIASLKHGFAHLVALKNMQVGGNLIEVKLRWAGLALGWVMLLTKPNPN